MFAVLGTIEFDVLNSPVSWEENLAANYAEHPLINGKPHLQSTGDALDELRLEIELHPAYADPEYSLAQLRKALKAHRALPLTMGNGREVGTFVLVDLSITPTQSDADGTTLCAQARITLREYVHPVSESRSTLAVRD